MNASNAPGCLIALEGIDGSGKSTHGALLCAWLNAAGRPAVLFREPTHGPVGQRIRALMSEGRDAIPPRREFELFLEDRAEDVRLNIAPALAEGRVVLMDRYYISSIAYQGALGLDPEEIRRANEAIAPRPDLVILFETSVKEAQARIRAARAGGLNLFEREEYQERVRDIFDAMRESNIVRVSVDGSLDQVQARLRATVERALDVKPGMRKLVP